MRQAIVTKYHGPTNLRGSRIVARSQAGAKIVSYDHSLNAEDNHKAAAKALATKLGWSGHWSGGGLPDGRGYAFIMWHAGTCSFVVVEES